ncbi:MAG: hypothetical protein QOI80_1749 [Solirubrobacteraceae bacterium]|jgi:hypothetical protein|nr:hypothetical protein [Solirubrobacteraceae bacterium]
MSDFSDGPGIVALAAAGVAVIALLGVIVLSLRLRRLRAAQKVVMGPDRTEDLVGHAAQLHQAFETLQASVQETAARLDQRMGTAEHRLDGTLAYRALVRYDAYGELSGHQSTSIALLDAEHNGVVLSSIAHRESARLYCKQVISGEGDVELSPEEAEAVRLALSGELGSRVLET